MGWRQSLPVSGMDPGARIAGKNRPIPIRRAANLFRRIFIFFSSIFQP